jgi:hypothetical protein
LDSAASYLKNNYGFGEAFFEHPLGAIARAAARMDEGGVRGARGVVERHTEVVALPRQAGGVTC